MRRLLALVLIAAAFDACASKAYKCTNSEGAVAYQQVPCAPGSVGHRFRFAPAPVAAPPPAEAPRERKAPRAQRRPPVRAAAAPPATSYECRVANGEVFYLHGPCPAAVVAVSEVRRNRGRGRSATPAQMTAVSPRVIARADACRRIHAASASGRAGHERDETVSTYEKNLGRDPCR